MTTPSTLIAMASLLLGLVAPLSLSAAPISYQYDALHRLTQVAYPDGTRISYSYDPAGNRTQKTVVMAVDTDGDGIPDATDNCPTTPNLGQANFDGDSQGDACDPDDDNDGHNDTVDAFPLNPNEWLDTDRDGIGNNADPDDDNDGVLDGKDNCPLVANPDQIDTDKDGQGDACEFCWECLPSRGGWRSILKPPSTP